MSQPDENRPPGGAYPPPGGYPPQQRQPGYPAPAQPGYPPQPGYPAAPPQPGYPAQPGYPTQSGYPAQPGYPAPQSGYPAPGAQPGYPAPGAQPGYPAGGYPPPGAQPGYPAPQGQPGYGPPGYPARPGYPAPLPTSPGGQPLAPFADRLLAVLIDGAITGGISMLIMVPLFIIYFVAAGSALADLETRPDGTLEPGSGGAAAGTLGMLLLLYVAALLLSLLVAYLYYVEMTVRRGQTVGKRVMKAKIVTLDPAGSVTRGVLVKRYGTQMLCGFLPGGSLVDGLWQLWDKPFQQCLHDKAAKTVVVKVPA
ncbi:RDD family protein [Plantactinospora sp. CA-290183]|uniref:RDD family protein n=1 Tax=Plantactinospora sp. CA-290183 TaxID=3240006 RepID=UPI003D8B1C10